MPLRIFDEPFNYSKPLPATMPQALRQWQKALYGAGLKYDVNPWALAVVMWNESRGGGALTPPGPAGTGDFIARPQTHPTYRLADPKTGLPPGGHGWGLGLMQVDWGLHNAWALGHDWRDPQVNVNKAAEIFSQHLKFFSATPDKNTSTPNSAGSAVTLGVYVDCWRLERGLPHYQIQPWRKKYTTPMPVCTGTARRVGPFTDVRPLSGAKLYAAALASYNAGTSGVLQALVLGLPPEAPTTRQDYVSKVERSLLAWGAL